MVYIFNADDNYFTNEFAIVNLIKSCIGLAAHQHVIKRYQSLASHADSDARSQLIRSLSDVPIIRYSTYDNLLFLFFNKFRFLELGCLILSH